MGDKILSEYVADRDKATIAVVEGEGIGVFRAFVRKWGIKGVLPACFSTADDHVLEITCRKMVLQEAGAP